MYRTRNDSGAPLPNRSDPGLARPESEAAARAADALRRAGGALPVEGLEAAVDEPLRPEALGRCLRSRGDLFLLVEPPAAPWREAEWTHAERCEYEAQTRARARAARVLLVDGSAAGPGARAPALLRESLLSMWQDSPEDEQLKRELSRAAD